MSAILLFRCVAKGVLKKALAELQSGQGFRQRLLDIANQTYGEFQKETRTVRYLEVLAAVALASPEESKHISAQVVEELRSDGAFKDLLEKPETVERLLGYLEQVPVSVRNRFRRPMDPTGRSLPQDFRLARPEDLMVLLSPKAPQFRVGDQPVGNWRLVQLLGIGAFGEVWKAEDAMDGDSPDVPPVALKFCLSPESIRNLRHETGLLQRIEKHLGEMKGIVRLRKAWLEAEPPCLEYEYVNGGDLCGLMGEWLVQTPEKRATLALQMLHRLAKVIAPLHEMDPPIVHRDLKPANVLVSKGPNNKFDMKISDFGISGVAAGMALEGYAQSLSQSEILTNTLRGTHTPLYASPEQRAGALPNPTDDIHALGVIGFQLLVCDLKRSPTSDWDEELREKGIGEQPIFILRKCLARKRKRYQNCRELKEDLRNCLDLNEVSENKSDSEVDLKPLPLSNGKKAFNDRDFFNQLANPLLSRKETEHNSQAFDSNNEPETRFSQQKKNELSNKIESVENQKNLWFWLEKTIFLQAFFSFFFGICMSHLLLMSFDRQIPWYEDLLVLGICLLPINLIISSAVLILVFSYGKSINKSAGVLDFCNYIDIKDFDNSKNKIIMHHSSDSFNTKLKTKKESPDVGSSKTKDYLADDFDHFNSLEKNLTFFDNPNLRDEFEKISQKRIHASKLAEMEIKNLENEKNRTLSNSMEKINQLDKEIKECREELKNLIHLMIYLPRQSKDNPWHETVCLQMENYLINKLAKKDTDEFKILLNINNSSKDFSAWEILQLDDSWKKNLAISEIENLEKWAINKLSEWLKTVLNADQGLIPGNGVESLQKIFKTGELVLEKADYKSFLQKKMIEAINNCTNQVMAIYEDLDRINVELKEEEQYFSAIDSKDKEISKSKGDYQGSLPDSFENLL